MRATLIILSVVMLLLIPLPTSAHDGSEHQEEEKGVVLDVVIYDLNCQENESCLQRPSNLVEYFGADWCEPCRPVEMQLSNRTEDSTFIMSHHPSSSDSFFLNASKDRHMDTYRQYGYPSLVIGGEKILAGKTQALELENVISNMTTNWSGIDSVELNNSNLSVNGALDDHIIDVWTVKDYGDLTNLAVSHTNLENDSQVNTEGNYLVIMLSEPGTIDLEYASSLPAGGYSPVGDIVPQGPNEVEPVDTLTIVIITVLLLIVSLPATMMLFQTIRQTHTAEEE